MLVSDPASLSTIYVDGGKANIIRFLGPVNMDNEAHFASAMAEIAVQSFNLPWCITVAPEGDLEIVTSGRTDYKTLRQMLVELGYPKIPGIPTTTRPLKVSGGYSMEVVCSATSSVTGQRH